MQATGEDSLETSLALFDSIFRYAGCNTPITVVANKDPVVNPALHATPLSKLLSHAEIEIVHSMGHMVHHFKPDLIDQAVDRLVQNRNLTGS